LQGGKVGIGGKYYNVKTEKTTMTPNLPAWLNTAINAHLQTQNTHALNAASANITQNYRKLKPSRQAITQNADVAAYLAARLPATYAAVSSSLHRTLERLSDFAPTTMLDIGAGPGTASFAAFEQLPSLQNFTLLDDNAPFLSIAKQLLQVAPTALMQAQIINTDITKQTKFAKSELIIMAYALVELPFAQQLQLLHHLWQACSGVLLIVEPGTPKAYANLMLLRSELIKSGAYVVAPCMGQGACPLTQNDWCHFSQRLPRTRAHMQAKGANVPFEDEKFEYLALSRNQIQMSDARILAPPHNSKAGIEFKLCSQNGLEQQLVPSRDKQAHKQARKLCWGDVFTN
jgi:ribosomal protein RSM22 (predicted rRNA methylase)